MLCSRQISYNLNLNVVYYLTKNTDYNFRSAETRGATHLAFAQEYCPEHLATEREQVGLREAVSSHCTRSRIQAHIPLFKTQDPLYALRVLNPLPSLSCCTPCPFIS